MRNERVCLPEFVLGLVDHPERPDIGPDLADLARGVPVLAAALAAAQAAAGPASQIAGMEAAAAVDHQAVEARQDSRLEGLLRTLLGPGFVRV